MSKWKAEWIKKGDEEVEKSLSKFNEVEEEKQVPRQSDQMLIQSLDKNAQKKIGTTNEAFF